MKNINIRKIIRVFLSRAIKKWVGKTPGNRKHLHFYSDGLKLDHKVGIGVHCK